MFENSVKLNNCETNFEYLKQLFSLKLTSRPKFSTAHIDLGLIKAYWNQRVVIFKTIFRKVKVRKSYSYMPLLPQTD